MFVHVCMYKSVYVCDCESTVYLQCTTTGPPLLLCCTLMTHSRTCKIALASATCPLSGQSLI